LPCESGSCGPKEVTMRNILLSLLAALGILAGGVTAGTVLDLGGGDAPVAVVNAEPPPASPFEDGVIVAVVDTGVRCDHVELAGRCLPGVTFGPGAPDALDEYEPGHGTQMAGIILSVAPDVMILPVKVCPNPTADCEPHIGTGIDYALDNGAHVINVSIANEPYNAATCDAIARATDAGVPVYVAAGNMAHFNDTLTDWPGLCPGAIVVGGSDDGEPHPQSWPHPSVSLYYPWNGGAQPGCIGFVSPCDVIYPEDYWFEPWRGLPVRTAEQGTSVATAFASGYAALDVVLPGDPTPEPTPEPTPDPPPVHCPPGHQRQGRC
jgi:subtilisin family serine protease